MSEIDLMIAIQQVSLLKMQLRKQQQAVLDAAQERGASCEKARVDLEALRIELKSAEDVLRHLYIGTVPAKPLGRAA